MSLAQLQRQFSAYLLDQENAVEPQIAPGARRGLAVYHHAYRATLIACLGDSFDKTRAWLGPEAFEAAALVHIAAHPPASWTLSDYGSGFPETLAGLYPQDPEVEELAWLDWALRRAFDGAEGSASDPALLADLDWEQARLRLAPTLVLRKVRSNAAQLWSAMARDEPPPPAAALTDFAGLSVWRQQLNPRFLSLGEAEFRALQQALAGRRFGEICADLAADIDDPDEAAALAGGLLGRWLADGVVIGADSD